MTVNQQQEQNTTQNKYYVQMGWSNEYDGNTTDSFTIEASNFDEMLEELEIGHLSIKLDEMDTKDGDFIEFASFSKDYVVDENGNEFTFEEWNKRNPNSDDEYTDDDKTGEQKEPNTITYWINISKLEDE